MFGYNEKVYHNENDVLLSSINDHLFYKIKKIKFCIEEKILLFKVDDNIR